jgi:hypothetical protein
MASVSASAERPTGAALGQLIRLLSVAHRRGRRGLPRGLVRRAVNSSPTSPSMRSRTTASMQRRF